eukprot:1972916-Prymnesium_polylepis.1
MASLHAVHHTDHIFFALGTSHKTFLLRFVFASTNTARLRLRWVGTQANSRRTTSSTTTAGTHLTCHMPTTRHTDAWSALAQRFSTPSVRAAARWGARGVSHAEGAAVSPTESESHLSRSASECATTTRRRPADSKTRPRGSAVGRTVAPRSRRSSPIFSYVRVFSGPPSPPGCDDDDL